MNELAPFISAMQQRGFFRKDEQLSFIQFGHHYTGATEQQVIWALELTLLVQMEFDGSFYMSMLEAIVRNELTSKQAVMQFATDHQLVSTNNLS